MTDLIIRFSIQLVPTLMMLLLVSVMLGLERRRYKYSPFVEKTLRPPAHTLSLQIDDLRDKLMGLLFALGVIGLVIAPMIVELKSTFGKVLMLSVMAIGTTVVLFKLHRLFHKAWRIKLGYEGELYVGQELNLLMRQGAWVFHDVPYKYGNIDHVVISTGGVFAIETKAIRKPSSKSGRAESRVQVNNGVLSFPHVKTSKPITQARCHAEYLSEFLRTQLAYKVDVTPVVALPGWFVESENKYNKNGLLVINPKRGKVLANLVKRNMVSEDKVTQIVARIEPYSRTIQSRSDILDPDANEKFDYWNNRKHEEPRL